MIEVHLGQEPVPFARQVTVHVAGDEPVEDARLRRQLLAVLEEQPRALLCDLTSVPAVSADVVDALSAVARRHADWPGTPVGVASADPRLSAGLEPAAPGPRFVVGTSVPTVESVLAALPPAEHATTVLSPGLTAPRAARAFAARACLRWHLRSVIGHACLVTSELVTNAVLHAETTVHLTVSRCPGRLRIAVSDGEDGRPSRYVGFEGPLTVSGRGLLLVSSVCRAWGVHPLPSGKVVWAVLDDGTA